MSTGVFAGIKRIGPDIAIIIEIEKSTVTKNAKTALALSAKLARAIFSLFFKIFFSKLR
jgi:hypothetical protein